MKIAAVASVVALLAVPLAGCIDDSKADSICADCNSGGIIVEVPDPESVFATMPTGETFPQNTSKKLQVIDDQNELEAVLTSYGISNVVVSTEPQPVPLTYFADGKVLLLDPGYVNTAGYEMQVRSVDVFADYVRVNVVTRKPGSSCAAENLGKGRFAFVYVPTKKDVLVSESIEVSECAV